MLIACILVTDARRFADAASSGYTGERVGKRGMSGATVVAERDRAAARLLGRMPRLIASAQDLDEGLRRSAELVAEAARADVVPIRLGSVGRAAIVRRRHEIGDAPIDALPTRLV